MSFPAARSTDMTMHGGMTTVGSPQVLIGGMPAIRMMDMHACPFITVLVPHATGPVVLGAFNVLVGGMPQARMLDMCVCVGPPSMVMLGSFNTLVGMEGAFAGGLGGLLGSLLGAALAGLGGLTGLPGIVEKIKKLITTVRTGLDKKIDDLINKSATLAKKIGDLQKAGWKIKYGEAGKGTFTDDGKKEIVIDPNTTDTAKVVQAISHEAGHAGYKTVYVPPAGKTKAEYVNANTKNNLKSEGEATLTNAQARKEILESGGPDIGIAGAKSTEYQKIADKYPDPADRDKAREEIGDVYAQGEHPSNDTTKTYQDYYGDFYDKEYDKSVAPAP